MSNQTLDPVSDDTEAMKKPAPRARLMRSVGIVPRTTIKEVSSKAGVSAGTVSRVLNGKSDVAAHLAEHVNIIAASMGYRIRPNRRSGGAQTSDIGSIGYLVDTDTVASLQEPFYQHYLSGIAKEVTRRHGHVVFAHCRDEVAKNEVPRMIREKVVNAVIVKAMHRTPDAWLHKISSMVPTVLLMHGTADRSLSSVLCDNYGGIFQALTHLKDLGHRRIAFLLLAESEIPDFHSDERRWAFLRYANELGCTLHPTYIQTPSIEPDGNSQREIVHLTLRRLMDLGSERPTAVICAADVYAFHLLEVAKAERISIPRDLSVVSFMNTEACSASSPPLTSVDLHQETVGLMAVECLSQRILHPLELPHHVTVATTLAIRNSCAPPKP